MKQNVGKSASCHFSRCMQQGLSTAWLQAAVEHWESVPQSSTECSQHSVPAMLLTDLTAPNSFSAAADNVSGRNKKFADILFLHEEELCS